MADDQSKDWQPAPPAATRESYNETKGGKKP
jgi:hypothetical protein